MGFPKERKNPHVQSFVVATDQVSPARYRASIRFQGLRHRVCWPLQRLCARPWSSVRQACSLQLDVSASQQHDAGLSRGVGGALQVGLQLLMADGNVFKCYDHIHLTMFHSELGASKAILDAGYTIDCLMMR